ncbi:hypothetical protein NPIL_450081 [Nephila pilipes]|uniref:Uncharacterized protein n=1 Tax=Nephila pilipes TaxID=299642 RepID=A0A8X6UVH0_NEPPI|nr:hypothetical protein NPIL_450081 [Nephila pilipes]
MDFTNVVVLQILLVAGFGFVQAGNEKFEKLRSMMCDKENVDIAEKMMNCVKLFDIEEYRDMLAPCGNGLQDMGLDEMLETWCSTPMEELEKMDECITNNVREANKEDEIIEKTAPVQECLAEAFSE